MESTKNYKPNTGQKLLGLLRNSDYIGFINLTFQTKEEIISNLEGEIASADDILIFMHMLTGLNITEDDLDKIESLWSYLDDYSDAGSGLVLKLVNAMATVWAFQQINFKAAVNYDLAELAPRKGLSNTHEGFKKIYNDDISNRSRTEEVLAEFEKFVGSKFGEPLAPQDMKDFYQYMKANYEIQIKSKGSPSDHDFSNFFLQTYYSFKFKKIHARFTNDTDLSPALIKNINKFNQLIADLFLSSDIGSEFHFYFYVNQQYQLLLKQREPEEPAVEDIFLFLQNAYSMFTANMKAKLESRQRKSIQIDEKLLQAGLLIYAYTYNQKASENAIRKMQLLEKEILEWKDPKELSQQERTKLEEKQHLLSKEKENSTTLVSYLPKFVRLTITKIPPDQIPQFFTKLPEGETKDRLLNKPFLDYVQLMARKFSELSKNEIAAVILFSTKNQSEHNQLLNDIKDNSAYKSIVKGIEFDYNKLRSNQIKNLTELITKTPLKEIQAKLGGLHEEQNPAANYIVALAKHIQDLDDPVSDTYYRVHLARQHRNALKAFRASGIADAAKIADQLEAVYAQKAKAASALTVENFNRGWRFLWTDDPKEPVWRAMLMLPKPTDSTGRNVFNWVMYALFLPLGGLVIIPARIILKTLFEGGALGLQKIIGSAISAIDNRAGVNPLTTVLMAGLFVPYAAVKAFRVILRALTSPIRSAMEAFKTGSVIHRRVGIAFAIGSGLLSAAWAVALSLFASFGLAAGTAAIGSTPFATTFLGKVVLGIPHGLTLFGAKLSFWGNSLAALAGGHPLVTAFSVAGLSVEPALAVGTAVLAISLPFIRKVADLAVDGVIFAAKSIAKGLKSLGQNLTKQETKSAVNPQLPIGKSPIEVDSENQASVPEANPTTNTQPNPTQAMYHEFANTDHTNTTIPTKMEDENKSETSPERGVKDLDQSVDYSLIPKFNDDIYKTATNPDSNFKTEITAIQALLSTRDDVEIRQAQDTSKSAISISKTTDIQPLLEKLKNNDIRYTLEPDEDRHRIIFEDVSQFQKAIASLTAQPTVTKTSSIP